MNNVLNIEINTFEQKMSGYLALFNYRMMNLCVKAEPAALMPVTVVLIDGYYNIEDVATIGKLDDYRFLVVPKNKNNYADVMAGIFDVHPEFKVEEKTEHDEQNEEVPTIIYTMPDVDKDRRDLLEDTTKTFHKECLARIEAEYVKQTTSFVKLLEYAPAEEADEARQAIRDARNQAKDQAEEMLKAKLQEIEEGYQRYLKQQAKASEEFDYTKGFRLGQNFD